VFWARDGWRGECLRLALGRTASSRIWKIGNTFATVMVDRAGVDPAGEGLIGAPGCRAPARVRSRVGYVTTLQPAYGSAPAASLLRAGGGGSASLQDEPTFILDVGRPSRSGGRGPGCGRGSFCAHPLVAMQKLKTLSRPGPQVRPPGRSAARPRCCRFRSRKSTHRDHRTEVGRD
jgi:hypothetical protein